MSGGGRVSSGIAGGVKKTIQDIREIAGPHSDEDIHAMLRECSMDPNETIQRLLHLDTFHEVKKKHGRRKENAETRAFDNPGKQYGPRFGKGVKIGQENFHSQNASLNSRKRSQGSNKENGYVNVAKDHKLENKIAHQRSRSVNVKVNGNNSQDLVPEAHVGNINYAAHDSVTDISIPEEARVPANGVKLTAPAPTPPSDAAKQGTHSSNGIHKHSAGSGLQSFTSVSSETVQLKGVMSLTNSVHEDQFAYVSGDSSRSDDKIQNGDVSPKNQLVDCNGNGQPWQAQSPAKDGVFKEKENCAEVQSVSEERISMLNQEVSKLNISDGHVVFPDHLQVPEAYKTKLTFGSFDSCWALDDKQTNGSNVRNNDSDTQVGEPSFMNTIFNSSIESNGVISSPVKDALESECSSYQQPLQPLSENIPPLTALDSSATVIEIHEPQTDSLSNDEPKTFICCPRAQQQACDDAETQGGNFTASSTSNMDQNGIQSSGVTHDLVSSPPPAPLMRQMFHPNFLPYGHYYPQFYAPQVLPYITSGGFPQQPSVPNVYFTPPAGAAAGIKYPHQQQKQGLNGTDGFIGVPSGYNPYFPYMFPGGLPPVVIPGSMAGEDENENQSKENTVANMTEQQIESLDERMAGTAPTVPGLQVNPFYSFAPVQGHPMVFPPIPAAYGAFGGVHDPAAQAVHTTPSAMHPQMQQPHSVGSDETAAAAGFYPQGTHMDNKQ